MMGHCGQKEIFILLDGINGYKLKKINITKYVIFKLIISVFEF
jgi:hypothetical protein